MAPMTRNCANEHLVPTIDMAHYYARRSEAGLIITEGTIIRPDGRGYSNTPGIFNKEQIEGWQRVTEKVHAANGKIFCQIWHVGRVSHPVFLNGKLPLGPSKTQMSSRVRRSHGLYYGENRALKTDEIQTLVEDFANAAENAMCAGFDGVEIHGANGYLIDQFLHYSTNFRSDDYGGTVENMARFPLEVVQACAKRISPERVGIRISPAAYLNEIEEDGRDEAVFRTFLRKLEPLNIAYIHTGNFNDSLRFTSLKDQTMTAYIRKHYGGMLVACGGYTFEEAEQKIQNGEFDCVAIGRRFIANPDLIHKFQTGENIQPYDETMLQTLF